MLTVGSLLDELDLELATGAEQRRRAGPLGAHLRAAGPDPVAVGRGADADHRHPARHREEAARLRRRPRRAQPRGARLRHRVQPQTAAEGAGRRGREARLPALRGPLLDPVHRDHREGLHPAGQRAVRGAAARPRDPAAARAAGAGGARAGGNRRHRRLRGRRDGGDPRRPRRAPRRARLPPPALRRGGRRDPPRGRRPRRRRPPLRPLAPLARRAGARPPGRLARAAGRRRPGW